MPLPYLHLALLRRRAVVAKATLAAVALALLCAAPGCRGPSSVNGEPAVAAGPVIAATNSVEVLRPVPLPMPAPPVSFGAALGLPVDTPVALAGAGALSIDTERWLHGGGALRWDWQPGDELTIRTPVPYVDPQAARAELGRPGLSTFRLYLYAVAPVAYKLEVSFESAAGEPRCSFEMGLGFRGWRAAWVPFDEGMAGSPDADMACIRLRAPALSHGGTLYLDNLTPASAMDARYHWPDAQLPNLGRSDAPPAVLSNLALLAANARAPSAIEQQDAATLAVRVRADLLARDFPFTEDVLWSRFAALGVWERDGQVHGPRVLTDKQSDTAPPGERVLELRDCGILLRDLAIAWHRAAGEGGGAAPTAAGRAEQARLAAAFCLLVRHLMDQGWTEGSALGAAHHIGYQTREWAEGVFLMREPLAEAGLLTPTAEALRWVAREFIDLADPSAGGTRPPSNMDYLRTIAPTHLILVLLQDDATLRCALLRRYAEHLANGLAETTPGVENGLKPDGCGFHHGGHYPGYAYGAISVAISQSWTLRGTTYALPDSALANLRRHLMMAWISSNPQTGIGLSGRHPFNESSVVSLRWAFRQLAMLTSPPDPELAAIALTLFAYTEDAPPLEIAETFGPDLAPAALPQGHWSYNYAALGIHRWHDRMVTLKGYSAHVWSAEIYQGDNRYGRYQSDGSVQIVAAGPNRDSGYLEAGWDWNRLPGATTLHRPLALLDSPRPTTTMLRSPHRFVGSSNLQARYGAFVMQLAEPDMERFDSGLGGIKTVFAFDDYLVCLGSGLRATDPVHSLETTLFQHALVDPADHPSWLDDATPIRALGVQRESAAPTWLVDGYGNGYVVLTGPVHLARQHQQSRHNKTRAATEGDFAVAWIDHGLQPRDASYDYAILLETDPARTAAFAAAPSYRVLRQDAVAHVVEDRVSGVQAAVILRPGPVAMGPLVAVESPCIVMLQPTADGLSLSLGTPDLHLPKPNGASVPTPLTITLTGRYQLAPTADQRPAVTLLVQDNETHITVTVQDGQPRQVQLLRAPAP